MASSYRERRCWWRAVGNAIFKLLERINGFDSWDWTDEEVVQTHGSDTWKTTVWTIWVEQRYDLLGLRFSFWMIFMSGIIDGDYSIMFIWWSLYYNVFFIRNYYVWFIHYAPAIIPIVKIQRKRKLLFVAKYCSKLSYSNGQFESKLENCQTVYSELVALNSYGSKFISKLTYRKWSVGVVYFLFKFK